MAEANYPERKDRDLTPEEKEQIRRAIRQGKTVYAVAEEFNCSTSQVAGIKAHLRNPPWTHEELILALDLYLRRWPGIEKDDPELQELSNILNRLPIHSTRPDEARFRNPNGVHMKLANFVRFDPTREGSGLSRGGKLEKIIWETFADDRPRLKEAVKAIKTHTSEAGEWHQPEDDEDEVDAREGRLLYRAHRQRERSPSLVKKKARALKRDGALICEVCGFDFQTQYGLPKPFIECHHLMPLPELRPGQRTRLADLALVCANCHRALHRMADPSDLTVISDSLRNRNDRDHIHSQSSPAGRTARGGPKISA